MSRVHSPTSSAGVKSPRLAIFAVATCSPAKALEISKLMIGMFSAQGGAFATPGVSAKLSG